MMLRDLMGSEVTDGRDRGYVIVGHVLDSIGHHYIINTHGANAYGLGKGEDKGCGMA